MPTYELKPEIRQDGTRRWALTFDRNDKLYFAHKEKSEAVNHAKTHCAKFKYNYKDEPTDLKIYYINGKLHKHLRFEVGKNYVELEIVSNKSIWGAWFNA